MKSLKAILRVDAKVPSAMVRFGARCPIHTSDPNRT